VEFGCTMSNNQMFAKGRPHSHSDHVNLFRKFKSVQCCSHWPTVTGQDAGRTPS
jgi:hypothetical protein